MKNKFKAGDLVYYPRYSNQIQRLTDDEISKNLPLTIRYEEGTFTFSLDGKYMTTDFTPSIFPVTEENRELLSKLYGIEFQTLEEFETIEARKPHDVIKSLLAAGETVWVGVSDKDFDSARIAAKMELKRIQRFEEDDEFPIKLLRQGCAYRFAVPIDPVSMEEIMDFYKV